MSFNGNLKKSKLKMSASIIALTASLGVFWDALGMEQENGVWDENKGFINPHIDFVENDVKYILPQKQDPRQPYRILSLDGGGLRGLITLPQLVALEMLTGKKTHELFDGIGGTSTGGIASLMLVLKKGCNNAEREATAMDCLQLYLHCGREIFRKGTLQGTSKLADNVIQKISQGKIKWNSAGLENISKMMVGEAKFSSEIFNTDVFITSTDETKEGKDKLHIWSTLDPKLVKAAVWEVLRSTSAAMSYFPDITINMGKNEDGTDILHVFVDGGHVCNVPALEFFNLVSNVLKGKASLHNNDVLNKDISVISIGTGDLSKIIEAKEANTNYAKGHIDRTIQNHFSAQEVRTDEGLKEKEQSVRERFVKSIVIDHENIPVNNETNQKLPGRLVSYARSQTKPLTDSRFANMDDVSISSDLFDLGIKQILSDGFKSVLQIFGLEPTNEELVEICKNIHKKAYEIKIVDTHGVALLGNICSFINHKEDISVKGSGYFFNGTCTIEAAENFFNEHIVDIKNATTDQILAWTYKMAEANAKHDMDKCAPYKVFEFNPLGSPGSHQMIATYVKKLHDDTMFGVVKYLRNINKSFPEMTFVGKGLDDVIANFCSKAGSHSLWVDNQQDLAKAEFLDLFVKPLCVGFVNKSEYKENFLRLVSDIIIKVKALEPSAYGSLRDPVRVQLGFKPTVNAYTLLEEKLLNLKANLIKLNPDATYEDILKIYSNSSQ